MSHIGLVSPAYTGHVNPLISLGQELKRRGHEVSLISTPDARDAAVRGDIKFISVGEAEYPLGSLDTFTETNGKLTGVPAIRYIMKDLIKISKVHARDMPDALASHGVDALVVDQILPMGSVVAEKLDIPYVNVCSLLPLNTDVSVPPFMMPWPYSESTQAKIQQTIGYRVQELIIRKLRIVVNNQRVAWGMQPTSVDGTFSPLAQIAQVPESIDYPRKNRLDWFHNTAPITDFNSSEPMDFPWDRLDGRPLIYGSMGTLQNRIEGIFHTIAEACVGLDAQLVITLGRRDVPIPTDLPGDPIVVGYAPQLELLKRASFYIGHGGLNTALHALSYGLPMVLLPCATDQPGVSARMKRVGVAEFIPVRRATPKKLRAAIDTVMSNPSYRENARKFQDEMRALDGVNWTADIIEEAFRTRQPVLRGAVRV